MFNKVWPIKRRKNRKKKRIKENEKKKTNSNAHKMGKMLLMMWRSATCSNILRFTLNSIKKISGVVPSQRQIIRWYIDDCLMLFFLLFFVCFCQVKHAFAFYFANNISSLGCAPNKESMSERKKNKMKNIQITRELDFPPFHWSVCHSKEMKKKKRKKKRNNNNNITEHKHTNNFTNSIVFGSNKLFGVFLLFCNSMSLIQTNKMCIHCKFDHHLLEYCCHSDAFWF